MPQADNIVIVVRVAGNIKLALSVALRNTANPFNIVLPLKVLQFSVVASG
jgi:hypothetical protein